MWEDEGSAREEVYHWHSFSGNLGGSGSANKSKDRFADIESTSSNSSIARVSFSYTILGNGEEEIG